MTSQEIVSTKAKYLEKFRSILERFDRIETVEDIEKEIIRGQGLSKNTYRAYMSSIRTFCGWLDKEYGYNKHPFQLDAGDIEGFYDARLKGVSLQTAYLDIAALKKLFIAVKGHFPFWESPFDDMKELKPELWKKLHRGKTGAKKRAMTDEETVAVLEYLARKTDPIGKRDFAMVLFMVNSGLRASEACSLTWGDIWKDDEDYKCRFIQKGGAEEEQELPAFTVDHLRSEFRSRFKRNPKNEDHLFYTFPSRPGEKIRPLIYHTMWRRFKEMETELKAQRLVRSFIEFSPHLTRRTYGTSLSKEIAPHQVQGKLRHKSLDTTLKHYLDEKVKVSSILKKKFGAVLEASAT
jgi:integrase